MTLGPVFVFLLSPMLPSSAISVNEILPSRAKEMYIGCLEMQTFWVCSEAKVPISVMEESDISLPNLSS